MPASKNTRPLPALDDTVLASILTPQLKQVAAALAPDDVRLVGGVVRDALLGTIAADIDLATPVVPSEVMQRLKTAGIKAIPTGIDHGTITAVANGMAFEITTLRQDVATDGRRATVAFTTDWQTDAARRDFTFNALFMSLDGEIFDYFNGRADLAAGRVRFIGEAADRIREDYLRILRFFRFLAWLGRTRPDKSTLAALHDLRAGLTGLSAERVTDELKKLLAAPNPRPAVALMDELEIWNTLELGTPDLAALADLVTLFPQQRDPLVRLAALFPANIGALPQAGCLRLSNTQQRLLTHIDRALANEPPHHFPARAQAYWLGPEVFTAAVQIAAATSGSNEDREAALTALAEVEGFAPPTFPLSGKDLMARGYPEGEQLGDVLQQLEEWWVDNDFPNRAETLAYLKQFS